jgi:hypothetical protein
VLLGSPDERRAFSAWANPTKIAIAANKIGKEIFIDQTHFSQRKSRRALRRRLLLTIAGLDFRCHRDLASKRASVWLLKD